MPSSKYPAEFGELALFDGKLGNDDYNHSAWMGFEEENLEAIIDLGELSSFEKVSLSCLENKSGWIFLPTEVKFFISNNGKAFKSIGTLDKNEILSPEKRNTVKIGKKFDNVKTRYLKITAKNIGQCPQGHPGEGGKAWLFVDEIIVE